MKKLSKTQQQELSEHVAQLADKKQEIDEAWEKFEEAHGELAAAIEGYNSTLSGAIQWRDDIVTQMTDYQGERSDKWQESDAGQAYQAWIDEWESIDLDEVETPDIPSQPEPEHIEAIEQLPQEADAM